MLLSINHAPTKYELAGLGVTSGPAAATDDSVIFIHYYEISARKLRKEISILFSLFCSKESGNVAIE